MVHNGVRMNHTGAIRRLLVLMKYLEDLQRAGEEVVAKSLIFAEINTFEDQKDSNCRRGSARNLRQPIY